MDVIKIRGARTHNLKNVDVDLKLNAITVLSGPSGSGKTSLAFHTLLTESKRRFLNSFPTDVKFFWDIPQTADVDSIFPVLPVWGLSQHNPVVGSRPAVVDHLDLSEKFEKVFNLIAHETCSVHLLPYERVDAAELFDQKCRKGKVKFGDHVHIFIEKKKYQERYGAGALPSRSFNQGNIESFDETHEYWEVLRFKFQDDVKKNAAQLEKIVSLRDCDWLVFCPQTKKDFSFSSSLEEKCPKCDELSQRRSRYAQSLSPYNPMGACKNCQGHGMLLEYDRDKLVKDQSLSIEAGAVHLVNYSRFQHFLPALISFFKKSGLDTKIPFDKLPAKKWSLLFEGGGRFPGLDELIAYLEARKYKKNVRIYLRGLQKEVLCPTCSGTRVSQEAQRRLVVLGKFKLSYQSLLSMNLREARQAMIDVEDQLRVLKHPREKNLKKTIQTIKEIIDSCCKMNLGHLRLSQKVRTLSASIYQRLLLVKFTSFEGSGSLLVLDEPSLGLNLAEQKVLLDELEKVKKQGNTILLIDHSDYIQSRSDQLIEVGPGAGHLGGQITYQGKYKKKAAKKVVKKKHPANRVMMTIKDLEASQGEFKELKILKHGLNAFTGNSDSKKEELCLKILPELLSSKPRGKKIKSENYSAHVEGADDIGSVMVFDGSVGRTSSRSTIGTMLELTPQLRKHYAGLDFSKSFQLEKGHFSPNSELGKCLSCEGRGVISHDMQFMEDVVFTCDDCKGMKLKPFYATISDGHHTFHESVSLPMSEVLDTVPMTAKFKRIWEYIKILNLDYLSLDRSFSSLSGGERLRVKLLAELTKSLRDSVLIFENLSFGLSATELDKLVEFLFRLCDESNTIILLDESPELLARVPNVLKL